MQADAAWDWEPGARTVLDDATACAVPHEWVEEPEASPDGESLAAVVNVGDGRFTLCVNGQPWETDFEKAWYPRYSPDGRLTAITMEDMVWTVYSGRRILGGDLRFPLGHHLFRQTAG
jgi:hypothetical protein